MHILIHRADGDTDPWVADFAELLPEAEVVVWREGEKARPCDYALVWSPPQAILRELSEVKAIFNAGAGVDAILKFGEALPAHVPVVRLDDAGMGVQMAEYVTHAVLRYFRRFDEYEAQARAGQWRPLPTHRKEDFSVGVLGAGVLGGRVLEALAPFGFPLRGWSRTRKQLAGVECFSGADGLDAFLRGTRVLVCMLPLTPDTHNLLDRAKLSSLLPSAYLINVARGAHVAEPDLLTLIKSGRIAGATLDVLRNEPLPMQHPFWQEPRITLTPHISALTVRRDSVAQIAEKIRRLEAGLPVAGLVNRQQGY
ncbi:MULTISPECIES: 2-hydroxyacid dehydrogenase [unclassified Janthinobacterium]|uniref:2-hydroxyacid dehydrogenase n=1 Tax=unclassified Janthinobacterium TaxID=2610881 RepID=UPI000349608F|nr:MULTISPECIES: glyoxylate/hydroxypyruvate reductase A [unclassified Janthinobacterium]MEC5160117.1 glyoxylate/hydroxypyruvate reductase A [Janthinobacterium sp. CG_S6]